MFHTETEGICFESFIYKCILQELFRSCLALFVDCRLVAFTLTKDNTFEESCSLV